MSYSPARIGEIDSLEGLREYVQEELEKISKEFNETIALDLRTVHQEPKRPREGMIVSADGTNWNPGSGAGAYEFVNGVWRRVAGIVDGDYGDISISGGVWSIDNNVVTFAKMADVATARILGRLTAGTGDPEALTGTQVTTMLDAFTSALKGLVPASGGGTTNFLRADGSFAEPPGTFTGLALAGTWTWSTNVTVVDFANLGAYKQLWVAFQDLTFASAASPGFFTSTDNGSSFTTGGGTYASTAANDASATTATGILNLTDGTTTVLTHGHIGILGWNDASYKSNFSGVVGHSTNSFVTGYRNAAEANNALRFTTATAVNITGGVISVWGMA